MSTIEHPQIWRTAHTIATLFMAAYMTARSRTIEHASGVFRLLGQRDHLHAETALLERELAIFRANRSRKPPKQRPHYAPEERSQILMLMALRHWSPKTTAKRFGVHPNTIRNWAKAADGGSDSDSIGAPPWNTLHQGVRDLVKEIRRLCPEPEFGSRTITRHILRAGIAISRTSVRRILHEERSAPRAPQGDSITRAPKHLQHPTRPHQVWHLDMTELRVLWKRFEVAIVIDGYTRKILAARIFDRRPTSADLIGLIRGITPDHKPRFLVSDHGSQFRSRFRTATRGMGITHARCSVGHWQLNAKLERVNRTLKDWAKGAMLVPKTRAVQRRVDSFVVWYNEHRPHAAHGTRTPNEADRCEQMPALVRYDQMSDSVPIIQLTRTHFMGDRGLVVPCISVAERPLEAA